MEFHQQHLSPMDQWLDDPDTGDILGVKANKAGALDFLPASERDFPRPNGKVYYVDFVSAANGGKGSNANSGRSWRAPFSTMAKAFGALNDWDTIVYRGVCTEGNLVGASGLEHVTILGGGRHEMAGALWKPNSGPCVQPQGKGWVFANFKVEPASGQPFVYALSNASDGKIIKVEANGGGNLIQASGSPDQWGLFGCDCHDMVKPISVENVLISDALRWKLIGNQFRNNDDHVIARLADSIVAYNFFQAVGTSKTATTKLDLRAGKGGNIVYRNFVGGTFSNAGGYYASNGANNDEWMNNFNNGGFREGRPA